MIEWLHVAALLLYLAAAAFMGFSFARGEKRLSSAAAGLLAGGQGGKKSDGEQAFAHGILVAVQQEP